MTGFIESAGHILSVSEKRLEIIAQNIANVATPGFQRRVSFESQVAGRQSLVSLPLMSNAIDRDRGEMVSTGNMFDIALLGSGSFLVRDGDRLLPSRGGSFRRDGSGVLVDGLGRALQQSGGGDVVVDSSVVSITPDGIILADSQPVARIGVYALDGSAFEAFEARSATGAVFPDEIAEPQVRQGMVEQSNVVLGQEMVAMMANQRAAEGGARLVQVYDELIGRVLTSFGQVGR